MTRRIHAALRGRALARRITPERVAVLGLVLILAALALNSELTSHSTKAAQVGAHAAQVGARASALASRVSQETAHRVEVEQRAACEGSAQRVLSELVNIDWPIYVADQESSALDPGTPESAIRGHEATSLLIGMKHIAAVRVDVSVAKYLPPVLAAVVRHANFHCPTVTAAQKQQ